MCSRYKFADEVGKKVVEQNSHVKNVLMALIVMGITSCVMRVPELRQVLEVVS